MLKILRRIRRAIRPQPGLRDTPFYSAYPFASPFRIEAADERGLIDDKLRVFYNRIPKVANTTLVFSLAALRDGQRPDSVKVKQSFRRPSQLNRSEVQKLDNYMKIVFFPRPIYARAFSVFAQNCL